MTPFDHGPFSSVSQTFTVAFDPTISNSGLSVTGYTVDNSSPIFNQPVLFENSPGFGDAVLYATIAGDGVTEGSLDFYTQFILDLDGVATSNYSLLYSQGTGDAGAVASAYYSGTISTAGFPATVPEAATWAMFLGGFGMIGGTLRRRQRLSLKAAKFASAG